MNTQELIVVHRYREWVLNINKIIYGQRQAGRVWNKLLVDKLTNPSVGFRQSKVEECVLYCGKSVCILYTENSIMEGLQKEELG